MRKIQILFPEPQLQRLRRQAELEDRPVSEIVRRATEFWLDRLADEDGAVAGNELPVFHGGRPRVSADELRDLVYADRDVVDGNAAPRVAESGP